MLDQRPHRSQKADLDASQFIVDEAGTAGVPADVLALMQAHLV